MKKLFLLLFVAIVASSFYAQTYTIVSRDNETIRMVPNALGASASALKSLIPGSTSEAPQYRLIKKTYQGKESLIFVDFTKILDKILVAYEADMETPCEWQVTTISYSDLYNAVTRRNAIYLSGEILGMKVEMFQRPPVIWEDIVNIDGVEFPLPLKICVYESELAQKLEKEAQKAEIEKSKEAKRLEQEAQKAETEKAKEIKRLEQEAQKAEAEKAKEAKRLEQEAQKAEKEKEKEASIRALAEKTENKAYVAYLMKSGHFEPAYRAEALKYFQSEEITNLIQTYSVEQLEAKAEGHSRYFEKYDIYY